VKKKEVEGTKMAENVTKNWKV